MKNTKNIANVWETSEERERYLYYRWLFLKNIKTAEEIKKEYPEDESLILKAEMDANDIRNS